MEYFFSLYGAVTGGRYLTGGSPVAGGCSVSLMSMGERGADREKAIWRE